jgi:hypothetical protein
MKTTMLILLLGAWAAARAGDAPDPGRLSRPGLPNLARVAANVYRGGRPDLGAGGLASLRALGVAEVIDLEGGDLAAPSKRRVPGWRAVIRRLEPGEDPKRIAREREAGSPDIDVVSEPLNSLDPITPEEAARLDRILRRLKAAVRPIYVHCEHGRDRTGLVIALYRVRYEGWTAERAAAEMRAFGHTGRLDAYFTGNMDLGRVLAAYPELGAPPAASAGDPRKRKTPGL